MDRPKQLESLRDELFSNHAGFTRVGGTVDIESED